MKIGILTLPLHTNYGGILQAYALQIVLERMGHEVFMLKKKSFSIKVKLISMAKRILKKPIRTNESFEIEKFKKKYFKNWIDVTRCTKQNLKSLDAVVVGSDQVWRCWGKNWNLYFYFLDFIKKLHIKKFAYSVSFGKESWEISPLQTERCKKLVSLFSKVSVREKSGIKLCQQYLGVDAEWLLDPTLLLNKNDYKLILGSSVSHEKKIVSYILDYDENKREIQQAILGLYKEGNIDLCEKRIFRGNENELPSVEFWLKEMMNAKFLVTDSFHGTAFAINFEIPFVVLLNENRGQSRLQSILEMFDLKNRFVSNVKNAMEIAKMPILWENVRKIKQCYKDKSISFLKGLEV